MDKILKLIKIMNDFEVVVNVGSELYIKKDQELEVFIPGDEIKDPDTGKSLGTLDTIKAYLNVKHVFPKMCICINAETTTTNPFASFAETLSTQKVKRLNVDSTEISGANEGSLKIRIGDLVRISSI